MKEFMVRKSEEVRSRHAYRRKMMAIVQAAVVKQELQEANKAEEEQEEKEDRLRAQILRKQEDRLTSRRGRKK